MFFDPCFWECGGIYVFFSDRSSLWQASGRGSHPPILKLCISEASPVGQCDPSTKTSQKSLAPKRCQDHGKYLFFCATGHLLGGNLELITTSPIGQCWPKWAQRKDEPKSLASNRDGSQKGTAMVCIAIKWCSLHRVVTMHISACTMCTMPCGGVKGIFFKIGEWGIYYQHFGTRPVGRDVLVFWKAFWRWDS